MSTSELPFRWRSIALPALLPTLLFSIGEGAIIPIIPIVSGNLGATLALAGLISALLMIGELVGDIPSGWLVSRIGERPAMIGASLLSVIGLVLCVLAPNPVALGLGIFLIGLATAVFALARHAFMTSFVPISHRARALSTLGGIFRFGFFVGPFLTALAIELTGTAASAFWIHIVACLAAAALLIALRDPTKSFGVLRTERGEDGKQLREGEALVAKEATGLFRTMYEKRGVLGKLGTGAALIGAMRASRAVILPLWALSIGISETNTALIIGIAGAADFALFYASGQIMDRWGRLASALPSMIGLGVGHFVLAFSHDLTSNVQWFVFAAMFMSVANGLGSGILMTLGADLADKTNPAPFLGAWRFTGGLGGAGAPLLVSGLTAVATISLAAGAMGVLGLVGAGILARYIPRYAPRPKK
ncbi:MFS transporter [Glaciihabitans arcticus]|uniref:MFS transporter n=1 Tax=Glaciihabitans arcticus TaxID=2668039 RepID=A0A4Q9GQS8_9MICO|nr:MFS transporter [Glaciihabitans arcticus]TBN57232.1 MFS transporter [Glaciihabitans arcticus]